MMEQSTSMPEKEVNYQIMRNAFGQETCPKEVIQLHLEIKFQF